MAPEYGGDTKVGLGSPLMENQGNTHCSSILRKGPDEVGQTMACIPHTHLEYAQFFSSSLYFLTAQSYASMGLLTINRETWNSLWRD
jgi:hypothetical protein